MSAESLAHEEPESDSHSVTRKAPPQKLGFLITESDIVEDDCGVESKCPWAAMRWWVLYRDTLVIGLTNNKFAIIPGKGMLPPAAIKLRDLASLLKIKGVAGENRDALRPSA